MQRTRYCRLAPLQQFMTSADSQGSPLTERTKKGQNDEDTYAGRGRGAQSGAGPIAPTMVKKGTLSGNTFFATLPSVVAIAPEPQTNGVAATSMKRPVTDSWAVNPPQLRWYCRLCRLPDR